MEPNSKTITAQHTVARVRMSFFVKAIRGRDVAVDPAPGFMSPPCFAVWKPACIRLRYVRRRSREQGKAPRMPSAAVAQSAGSAAASLRNLIDQPGIAELVHGLVRRSKPVIRDGVIQPDQPVDIDDDLAGHGARRIDRDTLPWPRREVPCEQIIVLAPVHIGIRQV